MNGTTVPTRQAVWPADLIERRRNAVDLETRIRALQVLHPDAVGSTAEDIAALRAEHAGMPCPHWDVHLADAASGEWTCDSCSATIRPTWVQLADQESVLRRAAHLRIAGRHRFTISGAGPV